jgi:hypothetical protein
MICLTDYRNKAEKQKKNPRMVCHPGISAFHYSFYWLFLFFVEFSNTGIEEIDKFVYI